MINSQQWFPSILFATLLEFVMTAWFLVELINGMAGRLTGKRKKRQDRGSFVLIYLAVLGSMFIAVIVRRFDLGLALGVPQCIGLGVMVLGMLFREWAIILLGRNFATVVTIKQGQQLITSGPYRWLRHPAYTGGLLTLIGLGLAFGTWAGAILNGILGLVAYTYRATIEEAALTEAFGQEYQDFARTRWRFFPGW